MSSTRVPLTAAQLRTIYETNPSPAVKRLLWEIHRLRGTVLVADQLSRRLGEIGIAARADTTTQLIINLLAERLRSEPAVLERALQADDTMKLFDKTARKK